MCDVIGLRQNSTSHQRLQGAVQIQDLGSVMLTEIVEVVKLLALVIHTQL